MTAKDKADMIYAHKETVYFNLKSLLENSWEEIVDVAVGRHILGHYEYGDTNLFEWSDGKVKAAILEELADAVVYQTWLLERNNGKQSF